MTIAQIEDAIVQRLKDKGLQVRDIDVQKGVEGIPQPAVYVATEQGKFERVSNSTLKQTLNIFLYIVFKHLRSEKERRRGIYPILEGIIGILTLQDMGLQISPLTPRGFKNITDDDTQAAGLVAYQIEFETAYNITKVDDEIVTDLLRVGLNYYLKPGDDVVDASDLTTLQ
jgi:hypothetical protein